MMPVEREFVRPDFVALGTKLACAEMIRSGTTCFADMYYFEEAVAEAVAGVGLRALCGQTVLKFPAPDAASFEDSLARARELVTRWKGHPLIVPAVAPHAPYTCTDEILRACAELACELDVPLHIHLAETAQEVEQSRREHGMPSIPWVKKQRLFDACVLAAHCVHVDEGDMRALKEAGAGVAHNPTSNLKLSSGVAPVAKMLELGVAVGIGTDGAAVIPRRCRHETRWRWRRESARARFTLARLLARSSPANARISSSSISTRSITCLDSTVIQARSTRSSCMPPNRRTSSMSCATADG
jgi:5-methylthioadenosine/S-adenosylhomocysteine deaminase